MTVPMIPSTDEWKIMREQCAILVESGFLPTTIKTWQQAMAIAIKGREMGVPPMQAFSHISIISGKPCISSEMMLSQIHKNCKTAQVQIMENTNDRAVVQARRMPSDKFATFSFSMEDARVAGLAGKDVWKKWPGTMLLWRAVSKMARAVFPDAINGASYTPEEMGAEVNEEGEIVEMTPLQAALSSETGEPVESDSRQKALDDFLEREKVAPHLFEEIKRRMIGKYPKDFPAVRAAVEQELTGAN